MGAIAIMDELEQMLRAAIKRFNARTESDPELQEKLRATLEGRGRKVLIETTDGSSYSFILQDIVITGFRKGKLEDPDIRVTADTDTYISLLKGELSPLKAYATNKIKLKMSVMDMLALAKFFKA
jgi:putative sterol carrier protein